jgi:hypothetical protein
VTKRKAGTVSMRAVTEMASHSPPSPRRSAKSGADVAMSSPTVPVPGSDAMATICSTGNPIDK